MFERYMKIRLLFFFILFLSILAIIGSFNLTRCSSLSLKVFDDLLGFTGIESACQKSKKQKHEVLLFRSKKYNSEVFPLIWTRATRWEPPGGLKYRKIRRPKIQKTSNSYFLRSKK